MIMIKKKKKLFSFSVCKGSTQNQKMVEIGNKYIDGLSFGGNIPEQVSDLIVEIIPSSWLVSFSWNTGFPSPAIACKVPLSIFLPKPTPITNTSFL